MNGWLGEYRVHYDYFVNDKKWVVRVVYSVVASLFVGVKSGFLHEYLDW